MVDEDGGVNGVKGGSEMEFQNKNFQQLEALFTFTSFLKHESDCFCFLSNI